MQSGLGADDVFSSGFHPNGGDETAAATPASPLSDVSALVAALPSALDEDKSKRLDAVPAPVYTEESESTLMQALLVGNFEVAVNCCLAYNQLADALLLASCGGPELWEKTQRAFFAHQQRPVMRVVAAIIKNELTELVEVSDLTEWRETLAILSTYAKSEEFPSLCDKLAARLEAAGDLHSATLCFMCAVNVEKTVSAWCKESEVEARTHGHTFALHRLVEKVSVFSMAVDQPDQSMGPEVAQRFAEYASLVRCRQSLGSVALVILSCQVLTTRCGSSDGRGGTTGYRREVRSLPRPQLRDPQGPHLQRLPRARLPASSVPVRRGSDSVAGADPAATATTAAAAATTTTTSSFCPAAAERLRKQACVRCGKDPVWSPGCPNTGPCPDSDACS